MTDLSGHVALVTGGSRGIGAAVSEEMAKAGAVVAIGYGSNKEKAEAYKAELNEKYPDADVSLHPGNIGVGDDCRRVIGEVLEQHGRLDILVNNAGITVDRVIAKMTDDDWNKVISVNLSGAFYLSQAAMAHMIERGTGRIVNVSSLIGEMGGLGQANYAASKSGLFALTKTFATEALFQLGRAGKLEGNEVAITVNAVTPGYISTEMVQAVPEKVLDRLIQGIPVKRLGHPEEIARVIRFLASDDSGFITGQVWGVNGGQHM